MPDETATLRGRDRRARTWLAWLTLGLVSLWVAPGGLAQEQEPDLIVILDASNSMWGQIDGVNKIVIARRAVGTMIDALPDSQQVGLIAYGHRTEGDCEDIEVLAEVGPLDKGALKSTINAISPKGKTPLTESINTAINLVPPGDSPTAIVLISDGLETCDMDPCSAVRTAKAEGLPFVLHVVGFDLGDEETMQLECAAQAGGGRYLSAADAAQLGQALKATYEKPVLPDGSLSITATADGALQDVRVNVVEAGTNLQVAGGRTYASADTNPRVIPLEDGRYSAEVKAVGIQGAPGFEFDFEIVDGNQVERTFDFSAGELAVQITRNGALSDAVVSIYKKGEQTTSARGRTYRSAASNPMVERLTAGTYRVTVSSVEMRNGQDVVFDNVAINGSERAELSHDFTSGVLSIGTHRSGTLVDAVVRIIDADGNNIGGGRTYTAPTSNPKEFVVAPGTYTVRVAEIRGEEREIAAAVDAQATRSLMIDLDQP